MDGYTLYISRCSGGDGVEESFKAKIKRREDALDAFAVAEAYCKGIGMVSRCEREGFDGFIIDLCSDAEDETIRLVRLVADRRIANGETLEDIVPVLMDDGADITSYDDLKRFAIEKIESDELYFAEHVLKACLDVADYYGYDYSMGTLENPTAIDGVEDLIDYVED